FSMLLLFLTLIVRINGDCSHIFSRISVIARIPTLKFLDASPVTAQERAEAEQLQKRIARADPSEYNKSAPELPVDPDKGLDKVVSAGEEGSKEDVAFGQT